MDNLGRGCCQRYYTRNLILSLNFKALSIWQLAPCRWILTMFLYVGKSGQSVSQQEQIIAFGAVSSSVACTLMLAPSHVWLSSQGQMDIKEGFPREETILKKTFLP